MLSEENLEDMGKSGCVSTQSPTFTTMIRDICAVIKVDEGETENNSSQTCSQINCRTQVGITGPETALGTRI